MQPELNVRKILGRTYLNENRLAEALDIFVKILIDYPDDLETLLILGGFYLAGGDGRTAKSIYLRAQQLDPQNKTVERQIMMAEEMEDDSLAESIPTDMESVARLLQRLTGNVQAIREDDILRAASLLEKIINCPSPADLISVHLDEIDNLLLALIEVNIRQARADGRMDLADSLRNLQLNIHCQRENKEVPSSLPRQNFVQAKFNSSVLMLLPDLGKKSNRMMLLKSTLETLGCTVVEKESYVSGRGFEPNIVIASNPNSPLMLDALSNLSTAGIPVILDLDADFTEQPLIDKQGGNINYGTSFQFADLITVPSQVLAAGLREQFDRVLVIPDGWSRQNKLWEKTPAAHDMINIGWVSTGGELEDLILIRRFIIRIIREFPNTRIVIIGNPQAYRLFDGLPETRRKYIPLVAEDEFPYLLCQLDILLVPLLNRPYNEFRSDTILMQAGARGIPWLASPIPSFREWKHGGILTESVDEEWHLNLRHLVMDQELRSKLASMGRGAARSREMENIGMMWLEAISYLTEENVLAISEIQPMELVSDRDEV